MVYVTAHLETAAINSAPSPHLIVLTNPGVCMRKICMSVCFCHVCVCAIELMELKENNQKILPKKNIIYPTNTTPQSFDVYSDSKTKITKTQWLQMKQKFMVWNKGLHWTIVR